MTLPKEGKEMNKKWKRNGKEMMEKKLLEDEECRNYEIKK